VLDPHEDRRAIRTPTDLVVVVVVAVAAVAVVVAFVVVVHMRSSTALDIGRNQYQQRRHARERPAAQHNVPIPRRLTHRIRAVSCQRNGALRSRPSSMRITLPILDWHPRPVIKGSLMTTTSLRRRRHSYHLMPAAMLALAATAVARADTPAFQFNGFGTLGAVVTDSDDAQFRSLLRQSRGATKSVDTGVDSKLGIQGRAQYGTMFSATAQLVASRQDGTERPRVEWLYAQADPLPWASLRTGRMALPTYLVSDSRNVGYAMHWLRAPSEMYAAMPISTFDGAQLMLRHSFGATNVLLQASHGRGESRIFSGSGAGSPLELTKVSGLNIVLEHGSWTARLGVVKDTGVLTIAAPPRPPMKLPPISDTFQGAGMQYDDGRLIVLGEWFRRTQDSGALFDATGGYVSAGWRMGSWTPYLVHGEMSPKGPALRYPKGRTDAIGLRWDAMKNVALKAQIETTTPSFQFVQESTAFQRSAPKVQVLSVAADFVF
jgi:hypothetical protein